MGSDFLTFSHVFGIFYMQLTYDTNGAKIKRATILYARLDYTKQTKENKTSKQDNKSRVITDHGVTYHPILIQICPRICNKQEEK